MGKAEEQEVIDALKAKGIEVVEEEPEHKIGTIARYRVAGKRKGENEPTLDGLGDTRENALRALLVRSGAS